MTTKTPDELQEARRQQALEEYQRQLKKVNEMETLLQQVAIQVEQQEERLKQLSIQTDSLQFCGQIIGEVLRKLDDDTCTLIFIFHSF